MENSTPTTANSELVTFQFKISDRGIRNLELEEFLDLVRILRRFDLEWTHCPSEFAVEVKIRIDRAALAKLGPLVERMWRE